MAIAAHEVELRIRGQAHAAEAAGTLHAWKVQKGQVVSAGEILATVRSATNGGYTIRAACSGVIRAILAPVEKKLAPGEVVCYVEATSPTERQESAPARPVPAYTNGNGKALQRPTERPRGGNDKRANIDDNINEVPTPGAAAARVTPIGVKSNQLVTTPMGEKKPKRERVKLRGLYLLPSQERAIKRLAAELSLDESAPLNVNDSELVRCALDNFFSMSPAAIRATVEAYKAKEKAAGTGAGWPRPGRGRKGVVSE